MTPYTITSATISDLNTITEFQMLMALETEELALEKDILTRGVESAIQDSSKGEYFILRDASSAKPMAMLMITKEWSDWRNGWVWWIQSVFVKEEFRKNGLYRALYQHIQKIVKESKDIRGIRLYVDKRNVKAQKVYNALGMTGDHYSTFEWMKD